MKTIPQYITDHNGHQHKIRGYNAKHNILVIVDGMANHGKERVLMGYDPEKEHFLLIIHNLEKDTIERRHDFLPWQPEIYENWSCVARMDGKKPKSFFIGR